MFSIFKEQIVDHCFLQIKKKKKKEKLQVLIAFHVLLLEIIYGKLAKLTIENMMFYSYIR